MEKNLKNIFNKYEYELGALSKGERKYKKRKNGIFDIDDFVVIPNDNRLLIHLDKNSKTITIDFIKEAYNQLKYLKQHVSSIYVSLNDLYKSDVTGLIKLSSIKNIDVLNNKLLSHYSLKGIKTAKSTGILVIGDNNNNDYVGIIMRTSKGIGKQLIYLARIVNNEVYTDYTDPIYKIKVIFKYTYQVSKEMGMYEFIIKSGSGILIEEVAIEVPLIDPIA
ncbi:hypothetical protein [Clostridium estertheticum]|uniref:hypothetical protein n=1 Tax=Clostridium estertheticum TaxID=238834 RepID=UPI001CF53384|nr:hypothetical protein [Clostridium estertheticum]MCB2354480.1 hypothetical protein [Clostridium estertheticum]WAG42407.1 hypothetical protein LL065_06945 [Clostridium estertheticum]